MPLITSTLTDDYKDITLLMRNLSLEVEKFVRTNSEIFFTSSSDADDNEDNSHTLRKIDRLSSLLDAYRFLILQEREIDCPSLSACGK